MKQEVKKDVKRYLDITKPSYDYVLEFSDLIRYELMTQLIRTSVTNIDFWAKENGFLNFYIVSSESYIVHIEITTEGKIEIK
jgi:hypothetical protein